MSLALHFSPTRDSEIPPMTPTTPMIPTIQTPKRENTMPLKPYLSDAYPTNFNWDATQFFSDLTERNKHAQAHHFTFCRVSGLEGFEDALARMQGTTAFVCVSDISQGYTQLDNTPHTRRVKTVFLAMRHAIDDMVARGRCMDTMRELFRQMMTVLILEQTRLQQHCIYIDPRISFQEIDRYFFSGCACAYFQIAVDTYTDLQYNEDLWDAPTIDVAPKPI